MADAFAQHGTGLHSPGRNGTEITPDDNNDLANVSRALWIGGAGTLEVLLQGDSAAVTIVGIAAGTLLPICAKRIYSTGTTATSIVALR